MTIKRGIMINENQVISSICKYLVSQGFKVDQQLNTNTHGVDIVASNGEKKLYIEAKGGTSADPTSKRYGLPFNRNQAKSHIGVALWKTGETLTDYPNSVIGIGLPKEKDHLEMIKKIDAMIKRIGIVIFWVDEGLKVEVEGDLL